MPNTSLSAVPQGTRVRIRMYRQGIGDCFLLTFYGGDQPRHIMIDCGVLSGTPNGAAFIKKVAASVQEETGNRLDALVATHEHWDHLSGFYDAADIFDRMTMGEIWVAWTEDPDDPAAREMKAQNRMKLQAVHLALTQLARAPEPQAQYYGQGIAGLMGFFGGPAAGATLAAFSEKTSEAMAKVTRRQPAPRYWQPGDLIQPDWLPGVKVYVLGPPRDTALLKKMAGRVGTEIYELAGADGTFALALEGLLAAADDTPDDQNLRDRVEAALPFHPSLQWPDDGSLIPSPQLAKLLQDYEAPDLGWRRIDRDWLLSSARLALQLDSATNNTSLVLAFEFTDTRDVLLFTADAQIGNWKSWSAIQTFEAADLLRRTIFYKVGHHGSHNATMKAGGLEAMTSPKLVAAIPVNQDFANNSKHWDMPAPALYARLQEKTRGRILRADADRPGPGEALPPQAATPDWQRFTGAVRLDPDKLFIDYFI